MFHQLAPLPACAKLLWLCSTVQSCGPQPTGLLCPWNSPGKNTGVGVPSSRGLPNPVIEPKSLTFTCTGKQVLYH